MSEFLTTFEVLVILGIIIFQIIEGKKALKKINFFKAMIPVADFFKIQKYEITSSELQKYQPLDILNNISKLQELPNDSQIVSQVGLINPTEKNNDVFDNIIESLNVYLLRNKGAATDFNLMKDIVERNIDAEEEEISQLVTVPLYLGLIGTMIGIVFGLANLYMMSSNGGDFEVSGFLKGVAIAMIASIVGLGWTVYNSNYNFKKAKTVIGKSKNHFYTFLQTELLPVLNQSVEASSYTLQTSLVKFNDNFTTNLSSLSTLLNKNYDALIAQEHILATLENINITEFAKANIKILNHLKVGTDELEKFSKYMSGLNYFVEGTTKLSTSIESLMNRVNNFDGLAQKIDSRVEESNRLAKFLADHYEILDARGLFMRDAVTKVDDTMIKSLVSLQEHTQNKIESIKQLTLKEEDLMVKNSSHFSKLSILADLKTAMDKMELNSKSQVTAINNEVKGLKDSISETNQLLKQIHDNSLWQRLHKVKIYIKEFFYEKK